jgi:hypothetical protein
VQFVHEVDTPERMTSSAFPTNLAVVSELVRTISDMLGHVMRPHFQNAGIRPRPRPFKVYDLVYFRPRRDIDSGESVDTSV